MKANWQLPRGVSRGLWDYVHDTDAARAYDAALADCDLLRTDLAFVKQQFTRPGKVIDLGCGTGRLALTLARENFQVLAVDLSAEMLRIVGEKATAAGLHLDRVQANLVDLDGLADGSFDYAACLFSTLGLIAGAAERTRFLRHVHRLLVPGGMFVVHVHNRWFNVWTRHGRRLLARDVWDSWTGRGVAGDYLMPGHHGIPALPMHLFTRREIQRTLTEAGFRSEEVQPVSVHAEGRVIWPWWFGWLRSYGYLVCAVK